MVNKKKVESLLICNSNLFIPTVLTEVLSHPQKQYLVISDTENIHHFFAFLNIPNVIYVEYGIKGRFDFIGERKKLNNKVNRYDIGRVVFFHAEFGEMANWLIKKLSKNVPICYCKIYDSIPAPHSKQLWKVFKLKLRQWIYWGVDMDVLEHTKIFPSIPKSFFRNVNATTISIPVDMELISHNVSDKLKDENLHADFVLLTGTEVATGKCDEFTYEQLINSVIDILGIEKTISKCHPRFHNFYGKEKLLRQIPSYIPGNVLIDNYDCYIGFESTLLVEAAKAGKKSISLIELLPLSDDAKQCYYNFFTSRLQGLQGKGNIIFIKKLYELKKVVDLK